MVQEDMPPSIMCISIHLFMFIQCLISLGLWLFLANFYIYVCKILHLHAYHDVYILVPLVHLGAGRRFVC